MNTISVKVQESITQNGSMDTKVGIPSRFSSSRYNLGQVAVCLSFSFSSIKERLDQVLQDLSSFKICVLLNVVLHYIKNISVSIHGVGATFCLQSSLPENTHEEVTSITIYSLSSSL